MQDREAISVECASYEYFERGLPRGAYHEIGLIDKDFNEIRFERQAAFKSGFASEKREDASYDRRSR